jgi:hypothetical protein
MNTAGTTDCAPANTARIVRFVTLACLKQRSNKVRDIIYFRDAWTAYFRILPEYSALGTISFKKNPIAA